MIIVEDLKLFETALATRPKKFGLQIQRSTADFWSFIAPLRQVCNLRKTPIGDFSAWVPRLIPGSAEALTTATGSLDWSPSSFEG